jgi:hypothetical protein
MVTVFPDQMELALCGVTLIVMVFIVETVKPAAGGMSSMRAVTV